MLFIFDFAEYNILRYRSRFTIIGKVRICFPNDVGLTAAYFNTQLKDRL